MKKFSFRSVLKPSKRKPPKPKLKKLKTKEIKNNTSGRIKNKNLKRWKRFLQSN